MCIHTYIGLLQAVYDATALHRGQDLGDDAGDCQTIYHYGKLYYSILCYVMLFYAIL